MSTSTFVEKIETDSTASARQKTQEGNYLDTFVRFNFDYEQISRVCFNLIKNSLESIKEKAQKTNKSNKNIDIEIQDHIDYISLTIKDTGEGFKNINASELTKPYFTTKANGTGLGLSIVSKIINDHNGTINFSNLNA